MARLPRSLMQNDSITWDLALHGFPASAGWVMTYYFAKGAENPTSVVATNSTITTEGYTVNWTCQLPPGSYRWFLKATLAGVGRTLESGVIIVNPDPSMSSDRRTHAEICLTAIEALIEGRLLDPGGSVVEMEVYEGYKVKQLTPEQMFQTRDRLMTEIRMQRTKQLFRRYPVRGW